MRCLTLFFLIVAYAPDLSMAQTSTRDLQVDMTAGVSSLNAAIDAANTIAAVPSLDPVSDKGKIVTITFPAGRIVLDGGVKDITASYLDIRGQGPASVLYVPCGRSGRIFTTLTPASRVAIHDLRIEYENPISSAYSTTGSKPSRHTFGLDGCIDCRIERITGHGGYGLLKLGEITTNSRVYYQDISFNGIEAALGGKCIDISRGTSQYFT